MNHQWVNVRAMETALTALLGVERMNVAKDLYRLLDNAENVGYQEGHKVGEEDGDQENFYTGYDVGFKDGENYAFQDVDIGTYATPLLGAAAALEPHETEQAPTPPADSPY